MGYNKLSDSGMSDEGRMDEAVRILKMLKEVPPEKYTQKESGFITKMKTARFVSTPELFWLRDLKTKYLE